MQIRLGQLRVAAAVARLAALTSADDEQSVQHRLGTHARCVRARVRDGQDRDEVVEVATSGLRALPFALGTPLVSRVRRPEDVQLGFVVHGEQACAAGFPGGKGIDAGRSYPCVRMRSIAGT